MRNRNASLAFIFVTILLDSMGIGLIVPVLPKLIESFLAGDLSRASQYYGYLTAIYALMIFLFAPLVGALSDRFGRRPILLVSLFGQGVDYLFMAVAPGLGWLAVGRAVSGLTGASITTAQAYIADVSPPERRAQAFGIVGAAFGLGFILGPALGGLLGSFGLRMPFYAAAGLALLNCAYGLLVLPESLAGEFRRPLDWRQANPLGAFAHLRRMPAVLGLMVTYALIMLGGQVMPSVWVLFTTYRFAWEEWQNGLSLAVVGLMIALVQGVLTRVIIPRTGEQRAAMLGLLLMFSSLIVIGLAPTGWVLYALMLPYALGGIAGPSLQGLMSVQVGPSEQGQLQGALTGIASVAAFVAPLLYTNVFAATAHPNLPWWWSGAPFWLAALCMAAGALAGIRPLARAPHVQS